MGSGVNTEYCSFTKAVEHMGDRWSLLIMRELMLAGPMGFNALASAIPGHISRSVLTERLHRLGDLGLIARSAQGSSQPRYRLAGPGRALVPTFLEFRAWADHWLPDDPAMVERDPEILLAWLAERVQVDRLPDRQVVVALVVRHEHEHRSWIVLEDGVEPYGCLEDPLLEEDRYVHIEAAVPVMMALARGRISWEEARADDSIEVFGDPGLVAELPTWFKPVGRTPASDREPPAPRARSSGPRRAVLSK